MVTHQLQVERMTGEVQRTKRQTFYYCATQPTCMSVRRTVEKRLTGSGCRLG